MGSNRIRWAVLSAVLPLYAQVVHATTAEAFGPVLDPVNGAIVGTKERELLPSSGDIGSIADVWFVNIVNQQNGGAGIAVFDPLRLGYSGRSWTETRFSLGGVDISDPGRPGSAIVDVPFALWRTLRFGDLFSDSPGFDYGLGAGVNAALPGTVTRLRLGGELGGGLAIPSGVMDREPALRTGAIAERRALVGAREVDLSGSYPLPAFFGGRRRSSVRLGVEVLSHHHAYPTLKSDAGRSVLDSATRKSAWSMVDAGPLVLSAIGQSTARSHEGGEFLHRRGNTMRRADSSGVVALAFDDLVASGLRLRLRGAFGGRKSSLSPRTEQPFVEAMDSAWSTLARVDPGTEEDVLMYSFATEILTSLSGNAQVMVGIKGDGGVIGALPVIPAGVSATSFPFGQKGPGDSDGTVIVFDEISRVKQRVEHLRAGFEVKADDGVVRSRFFSAWDHSVVNAAGRASFGESALALGFSLRGVPAAPTDGSWSFMARREPLALNALVGEFISPFGASGSEYYWHDGNSDGISAPDERGQLIGGTGGRFHGVGKNIRRPRATSLALAYQKGIGDRLGFLSSVVIRTVANRLTVRFRDAGAPVFERVDLHDPGGDGLGESLVAGGGQQLTAYARKQGSATERVFELQNAGRDDLSFAFTLQLYSYGTARHFFNLAATGYFSQGSGSFGLFPDRNDPAVLDESTASPNGRISQRGRYDHDRAFGINLLWGALLSPGVTGALALRYRDGQPITRVLIADLPQGPTPVMAVSRGAPVPRHTFAMTLDAKLVWEPRFHGTDLRLAAVIYNLLGSGTELLEDLRTGPTFRQSLEMVPNRALMVELGLGVPSV